MAAFFQQKLRVLKAPKRKHCIIEEQDSTRVLNKCFSPLFTVMIPLGVLPLNINQTGWATFKTLQLQFVFYILILGLFTLVTWIYAREFLIFPFMSFFYLSPIRSYFGSLFKT